VIGGDLLVHASGELAGVAVNADQLQPGTSTQAFPEGKGESSNNLIQVVRLPDPGGVCRYSAICTHLGCSVCRR
jgi:Rieske Fe-S protein